MYVYGLLNLVSDYLHRRHIGKGLTGPQRAGNHQSKDNYVVPVPMSQNS